MKRFGILVVAAGLLSLLALTQYSDAAEGLKGRIAARRASPSWQGNYYDPAWGMPLALVVPPTAKSQSNYAWGVGNTTVTRIGSQFTPDWMGPGSVYDPRFYRPTPPQPSDTNQFGVYYVRGPW